MQRFIAVATEYNVLNLVAIKALGRPGDEVLVLADPHARRSTWDQRLAGALGRAVADMTVRVWPLPDVSAQSLRQASEQATAACAPERMPGAVYLLAIGGRKHDMLLLQEMLRRRCQAARADLHTVSVDRRPFMLRMSHIGRGDLDWQIQPLEEVDRPRRVGLDEVLAAHGFRRSADTGLKFDPDLSAAPELPRAAGAGNAFERAALRFVLRHLPSGLRPLVTEVWWNPEIQPIDGDQATTEFDILLLTCDGSAVHLECKKGSAQGLQRKLFQMRRALTPESSIVLCRAVSVRHDAPDSFRQRRQKTLDAYANLGAFGIIQLDPGADPARSLPQGIKSPARELEAILKTTWLSPPSA